MRKLLSAAIFLVLAGITAFAQTSWTGNYVFTEDGGRNAGGTRIVITHEMDITEGENGLVTMVRSNGYQTARDLVCSAKVEGGKLNIYFESYGEDNMFESYEPGDLLLSLEKKTTKGKPELLTWWGKFTPMIPKNEKTGKIYFKRSE
jgi:hypothetical protein